MMSRDTIKQFQALEQRLAENFPEALREAKALSENIADPRTANADEAWARSWNKPLYAHTRVAIGASMVQKIAPFMDGAWRHWGNGNATVCFKKEGKGVTSEAFRAVTPQAREIRLKTGIPLHRLFAIQGAAEALRNRAGRSKTPYADLIDLDLNETVQTVQGEMKTGWGPITVLHFLTDLGLACKPDLHLVRTVRHLGLSLGLRDRLVPSLSETITINRWVRSLVEELDGSFSPPRLRYTDKVMMEISKQGLI